MTDADQTPAAARRVLVADNDPHVAAILEAFLRRHGLAVEVAPDGRVAMERLRSGGIDLLICDLDMPVMSGDALLERMRDDRACPPVVVISGYVDEAVAARLGEHPAVREVLRKPFDVRAFAARAAGLAAGGIDAPSGSVGGLF